MVFKNELERRHIIDDINVTIRRFLDDVPSLHYNKHCYMLLNMAEREKFAKILMCVYNYAKEAEFNYPRCGLTLTKISEMTKLNAATLSVHIWRLVPLFLDTVAANPVKSGWYRRFPKIFRINKYGRELVEEYMRRQDKKDEAAIQSDS